LLSCLKDEVARAWPVFKQGCGAECNVEVTAVGDSFKSCPIVSPFVSSEVLQVVESVLHPSGGTPPDLPSQIDSVIFPSLAPSLAVFKLSEVYELFYLYR
jgi:hypothetical protein